MTLLNNRTYCFFDDKLGVAMSTSILSYLTDFNITLFMINLMNYLQVVLNCQMRELHRFSVFEGARRKVNYVVTTSACLCVDRESQIVFP